MDRIRILYVARGRMKEKPLLEYLQSKGLIEFQSHDVSRAGFGIKKLFSRLSTADFKPNIVLSEGLGFGAFQGYLFSLRTKAKLLQRVKGDPYVEYTDIINHGKLSKKIEKAIQFRFTKFILKKADLLLPISKNVYNALEANYSYKSIVLAIPAVPITSDTERLKQDTLPTSMPSRFVISVTNFNFWEKVKLLPNYIQTIAPILKELNIHWFILGGGNHLNRIQSHDDIRCFFDNVEFVGHVDTTVFYSNAMAQIYISSLDSFASVIFESFQQNLPVIVNKEFPVLEIINNQKLVSVIDHQQPDQLKNILISALTGNKQKEQQRAVDLHLKSLSVERLSSNLLEIIKKAVDDKSDH